MVLPVTRVLTPLVLLTCRLAPQFSAVAAVAVLLAGVVSANGALRPEIVAVLVNVPGQAALVMRTVIVIALRSVVAAMGATGAERLQVTVWPAVLQVQFAGLGPAVRVTPTGRVSTTRTVLKASVPVPVWGVAWSVA